MCEAAWSDLWFSVFSGAWQGTWILSHQCLLQEETVFWATCTVSDFKITLFSGAELLPRRAASGLPIPVPLGPCRWYHPAVLWCKSLLGAQRLAENCSSPARMGQEDRAWWWEDASTYSSPEHPRAGTATTFTPQCLKSLSTWGSAQLSVNYCKAFH